LIGMANGFIEGAGNPLVAVLYRNEKAKWLNLFHAWYPGGVIMGGLVAYVLRRFDVGWQIQVATILIPTIAYGAMFWGREFPETERVASGVTGREMMAECIRPLFLFMAGCMLLTATTEIATNQWIAMLLEHSGVPGILILVWVTGFMTAGRLGIGPVVRRIGITGILILASVVSAIGLYWMSYSSGYWTLPAAATYAMGVCYYWPTMLSFVAERLPKSGAMGLAALGSAGMLAVAISLPIVGHIYDRQLLSLVPSGVNLEAINAVANTTAATQYASLQLTAGSATLRQMAILPCILIFAFSFLLAQQRGKSAEPLLQVKAVAEEA
jgi:fucose permease